MCIMYFRLFMYVISEMRKSLTTTKEEIRQLNIINTSAFELYLLI